MPARTLYVSQKATIDGKVYPVQSASCEVTTPQDDVFAFGILGSAGRFQKDPTTCKADVKIYLTTSGVSANYLSATEISRLTGNALAGTLSAIILEPNGFEMSGIMTSLGVDASNGQFVTVDMSFVGVGNPVFNEAGTTIQSSQHATPGITAVTPVTSNLVTVAGACVNSAKFNLDIPTEVISCLGGAITGAQLDLTGAHVQLGKPPFKATMNVEGTAAGEVSVVDFGDLRVTVNNGKVTSKSINQAVGNVGANYSFTLEALDASFANV